MSNQNLQIAKFYTKLFEIRESIRNEIIPCGIHVGAQTNDHELFDSLDKCADVIGKHLEKFHLKIEEK